MKRTLMTVAMIASLAATGQTRSFPNGARFQAVYKRGGEIDYIDATPLPGAVH